MRRSTLSIPLTVESCEDGATDDEHKNRVFAYDPSTGVIQPMWYEDGEGDGYTGDDGDDNGDDQDDTGNDMDTPVASPTPANVSSQAVMFYKMFCSLSWSFSLLSATCLSRPRRQSACESIHLRRGHVSLMHLVDAATLLIRFSSFLGQFLGTKHLKFGSVVATIVRPQGILSLIAFFEFQWASTSSITTIH